MTGWETADTSTERTVDHEAIIAAHGDNGLALIECIETLNVDFGYGIYGWNQHGTIVLTHEGTHDVWAFDNTDAAHEWLMNTYGEGVHER